MVKRDRQKAARETQLNERLSGYSALTRVSAAARSLHRRTGNWPIYAAATGSALAMATGASASIIYSGPIDATVSPPSDDIQPLDLDSLGHILNLRAKAGFSSLGASTVGFSIQAAGAVHVFVNGVNTELLRNFASGVLIGDGAGSFQANAKIVVKGFGAAGNRTSVLGDFTAGVPGLAGFAITGQGTSGTQTNYGWIRLEYLDNPTTGFPQILEAVDWAVQTDGSSIPAGYVPEPGTMSLGLLAVGAAGIAALRRRWRTVPVA